MIQLPDFMIEPEEPDIKFECDECGSPIYYGDEYYEFVFEILCPDCVGSRLKWAEHETV